MDAKTRAIRIIKDEHATLTAVIEAFRLITTNMADGKLVPDFKLLWSIIYYIEEYPEQLHHPKEDAILFPAVRARSDAINDTLNELQRQHQNSRAPLEHIKTLLGRVEADIPGALPQLAEKLATYSVFHWQHMRLEEDTVLPAASKFLTDTDWESIAEAFTGNADPISAGSSTPDVWFRNLFQRIVYLVPPPWGLGPR